MRRIQAYQLDDGRIFATEEEAIYEQQYVDIYSYCEEYGLDNQVFSCYKSIAKTLINHKTFFAEVLSRQQIITEGNY